MKRSLRSSSKDDDSVEELIGELEDIDIVIDDEPELNKITESDSKVINLVNKVLLDANNKGISDIHFEPGMGPLPLKIRYRKDGICYTVHQIARPIKQRLFRDSRLSPSLTLPSIAGRSRARFFSSRR